MLRVVAAIASVLLVSGPPYAIVSAAAQTQDAAETPLHRTLREAWAAREKNDFRTAVPLFKQAIDLAEQAHDDAELAHTLNGYAIVLWGSGDYAGSLAANERALAVLKRIEPIDRHREAIVVHDLGNTLYSLGRHDEALARYEQALALDQAAPDPRLEGQIRASIGLVYRYTGRLAEAKAAFERSLALRRQAGDSMGIGQSLNHLGMVSRALGQFEDSVEYYRQSLAIRRTIGDRQGEAQALNNLANVLEDLGEAEAAMESNLKALEIAEAIDYRAQIGFSNANIADLLEDLGRDREALEREQKALAVFRSINRRADTANALRNVGRLQTSLGNTAAARAALDEALELARATKEPEKEALTLETLGNLALTEHDAAAAVARQNEALAIARAVGAPNIEWEVLADRGEALRAIGRFDDAIADFRVSAGIVNDLRANVRTDSAKVGLFDTRRRVFYRLADTLVAAGRPDEALEVAEASRARAFADLLGQRNLGLNAAQRAALDDVRSAAGAKALAATNAADPARPATRLGSLDAALAALKSASPELTSLVTVESASVGEIRRDASRLDSTLVEYMVGDRQLLVWVVAPDGAVHSKAIETTSARLEDLAKRSRAALDASVSDQSADAAVDPLLRELHDALIAPIAAWLPARSEDVVIVVPDGPLAYVPFAALPDAAGTPFIAKHVLAYAPSASVFRYTLAKTPPAATPNALIVADPRPPQGANLAPLPWSRTEARAVAARLGAARTTTLQGAQATEAAVKRKSPEYSILHFATHGLVSTDRPLASSLMFADGDGEDGYLRVSEVFGLDLHARLVVLSGCSTGFGRLSSDGLLGLTRAFIFAGTPAVVVSQWDIADRAAAFLMDRFYAELARGRPPAHALRTAALAARTRFVKPSLWAAFELVGEPR